MKLIVALVRPERLHAVLSALNGREASLLAVCDVVTVGQGRTQIYRDRQVAAPLSLLRVEVAANDGAADEAVEAITRADGPVEPGLVGGKVFVVRLEEYANLNEIESVARDSAKTQKRSSLTDREFTP